MRLLLALLGLLLLPSVVDAQHNRYTITDTDPFELAHPETKEPGEWIPAWLKIEHLLMEEDLISCRDSVRISDQALGERSEEAKHRKAEAAEEKAAREKVEASLAVTETELQEEKDRNSVLSKVIWGTSGATVVAVTVIIIQAVAQ